MPPPSETETPNVVGLFGFEKSSCPENVTSNISIIRRYIVDALPLRVNVPVTWPSIKVARYPAKKSVLFVGSALSSANKLNLLLGLLTIPSNSFSWGCVGL